MTIMPILRLILNVRGVDGDLTGLFFWSAVDVLVGHGLGPSFFGEDFGDGLGEGGFAVVDVADGADVDVGFVAGEFVGGEGAGGEGCGEAARGGAEEAG